MEILDSARDYIAHENIFGGLVPQYQGLSEEEKRELWLQEGGRSFKGSIGDVRRYVVGVSKDSNKVLKNGFHIGKQFKDKRNNIPFFKYLGLNGESEGTGVYMTTNPTLALREYGPEAVVANVALGNCIDYLQDKKSHPMLRFVRTADRIMFPVLISFNARMSGFFESPGELQQNAISVGTMGTVALLVAKTTLFNLYYESRQADSARIPSNFAGTLISSLISLPKERDLGLVALSAIRHSHWLLVRDAGRIHPIAAIDHPVQALGYKT